MAAEKSKPLKGRRVKKNVRGRMPTKRTINLVLIDENRISIKKAAPAILLIVALAVVFSKYMVADRLIAVSEASGRVSRLRSNLDSALELSQSFGDVEDTYAHYTTAGMTAQELGLVDRVRVTELVGTILPAGDVAKTWSVSDNVLTVEVSGSSLETLNDLARQMEEDPIVDSCTITTANKDDRLDPGEEVRARFIVYLRQPPEEVAEP